MSETFKSVIWVGSSRRDLRALPEEVRRSIGKGLYAAQQGMTDPDGIVERFRTDAYRAVYTAHFETAVCTCSKRRRSEAGQRRNRKSI